MGTHNAGMKSMLSMRRYLRVQNLPMTDATASIGPRTTPVMERILGQS